MAAHFTFSARSKRNLEGVSPALVAVARRALKISPVDFIVIEGRRTIERQRQLVAAGASRTVNSRHLTGHALDVAALVQGEIRWDWPLYRLIADAFKQAAREQGVSLQWGGDWRTFKDGPHFEVKA